MLHLTACGGSRRERPSIRHGDWFCWPGCLYKVDEAEAANLFITRAEIFGKAQYSGVQQKWDAVMGLFDDLAQLEADLAAHF